MSGLFNWLRRFDVRGIIWRRYMDWAVSNLPFYMLPLLLYFWVFFFFFFAAAARRAVMANLRVVLPRSSSIANCFRTLRTIYEFAWAITDGTAFKFNTATFRYEITGEEYLDQLAEVHGAIVLTAHMGNYDLGAAVFAQKFTRELRMVRAPEPHAESEEHLNAALAQTGAGAVKVAYSTSNALLPLDLMSALREGQIVSVLGDRAVEGVSHSMGRLCGREVALPDGPFILSLVAEVPIFPLFIIREGYKRYRIIACRPIICRRSDAGREADVAAGLRQWCKVLEEQIVQHWHQWSAFVPMFTAR